MIKPKRFFYHYYKQYKCMSVHHNKTCTRVDDVICSVGTNTKWNNSQPRLVIEGFCNEVSFQETNGRLIAYIK